MSNAHTFSLRPILKMSLLKIAVLQIFGKNRVVQFFIFSKMHFYEILSRFQIDFLTIIVREYFFLNFKHEKFNQWTGKS
jgi:hypothetical protein